VLQDLADKHAIIATHHSGIDLPHGVNAVHWEAVKGAPEALLALCEPEAVVHLMALSRTEACSANPDLAQLLNVEVTRRLAQAAFYRKTRFVFTSTDLVFDGGKGDYTETDSPHPVNTYSRTKWEAEQVLNEIFQRRPNLLTIFRIGLSYGWSDGLHTGPVGWLFDTLKARKTVDLFQDEFRSPLYQGDVPRAIHDCLTQGYSGLYHLGGPEKVDRYSLGVKIVDYFNLDASLIHARSVKEYQGIEPRSPDCSMVIEKFVNTFGWQPVGLDEGLKMMKIGS
jgi:dTDP-4-dehydrorhamnose reductase